MNEKKTLCCLCGKRPATTRDHIPPRCIFPPPRPRLITIPTCADCNSGTSSVDEELRVLVSLFAGKTTPESQRLWKSNTLPTVRNNRRLLRKVLSSFQPGYVTSAGGILLEKRDFVVWDDSPNKVFEKMVRGLYYHHFRQILGDRAEVSVEQITQLTQAKADNVKLWQCNCVGDGQFVYRYARANDVPLRSAWLLLFHGNLVVLGQTKPAKVNG